MFSRVIVTICLAASCWAADAEPLDARFDSEILPFLKNYCLDCHDAETKKADLDLSRFGKIGDVLGDIPHWELVLERLELGDMPPKKSKVKPQAENRARLVEWIKSLRAREAQKHAGDPGPVIPRRLSNAEYDNTVLALTGSNIRPTRAFPVDPANQAGFDNSAESLALSPALVKKYLDAAREVGDHLLLLKDGISFAPHRVVADTDRDKWAVLRIVDFYRKQPTDLADYFEAAWRVKRGSTVEQAAAQARVSPKYLRLISQTLTEGRYEVGPLAALQEMWGMLPDKEGSELREGCEAMRDYVHEMRQKLVPDVKNLTASPIHNGSQTLVMWKNRTMAANRRKFDTNLLWTAAPVTNPVTNSLAMTDKPASNAPPAYRRNRVQRPTPEVVQKGGLSLPPVLLTKESSATASLAALKKRSVDPDLQIPDDPAERAKYLEVFGKFAEVFPDAFYITERARVYLDAEKEQENAGRLLSAGLHSMTGYFRDDQPLYDLILDEAGQRELDTLWDEFDMICSVPHRMLTSLVWFERTDSSYLRDPQFDPYRPEDQSIHTQEKIRSLSELYLAKAIKNNASERAQKAIVDHFESTAISIRRVDQLRVELEPIHLESLDRFAARAYRRPLSQGERAEIREFYQHSRKENGLHHEEAMRDSVVRILMSPNFLFRMDLIEAANLERKGNEHDSFRFEPLSNYALASRLSYFLWASMPDDQLIAKAAAGDLSRPEVLKAETRRLMLDARARNFAIEFAGNWLGFRRFEEHNSVDRERYPVFDSALRTAMFEEPIRFFLDVAQSNRSVLDLIYGRDTFVNATLARHYGFTPAPSDDSTWVRIPDAAALGRGGLLPMSVFLTANSPGLRTSPVKRGYWVVRRLFGERIPPPPAVVPELPSDEKAMGELTLRQALAKHRENEACAGCHARFDSFGLVFENYGPVGERREADFGGRPVDVRAEFPNGREGSGLQGLIDYVRTSREHEVVDNLCRKMLAYALGRTLILSDNPLVEEMVTKLKEDGYRFQSLIEMIVTSPQFLNKRAPEKLAQN